MPYFYNQNVFPYSFSLNEHSYLDENQHADWKSTVWEENHASFEHSLSPTILLFRHFDKRAVPNIITCRCQTLTRSLFVKQIKETTFPILFLESFGKKPNRAGIWNGPRKRQTKKFTKRSTITNQQFRIFIGKVIKRFENKNLKHQQRIKRRTTTLIRIMLTTKRAQRIKKNRSMDQKIKTNKEIVERVNFIELLFNVKK
jgi:hypothetical protein